QATACPCLSRSEFAREKQASGAGNKFNQFLVLFLFDYKTSCGSVAVADGIPAEDYETWIGCFDGKATDHRYYEIVHLSLKNQFGHYYLLLKDGEGRTRAIQPFLIV